MQEASVQPILSPDAAAMTRQLEHLFGGDLDGLHDGLIELAWQDGKDGALRHAELFSTDQIDDLVAKAVKVNAAPGQNTYFGSALRKPGTPPFGRCEDNDFYALPAYYVDLDDAGIAEHAKHLYRGCLPTLVVVTGRRPHLRAQLWWRHETPERDPAYTRAQLVALAAAFNGDPTVVNPSRVMRLAGSIAWPTKPGRVLEATELQTFADRAQQYSNGELKRAFPVAATLSNLETVQPVDPPLATSSSPVAEQLGTAAADTSVRSGAGEGRLQLTPFTGTSPDELIALIKAGNKWHNNILKLTGYLVSVGMTDEVIVTLCDALRDDNHTAEATRTDVRGMIRTGRAKWNKPNPTVVIDDTPPAPAEIGEWDAGSLPEFTKIQPRKWLLGNQFCRSFLSSVLGAGAIGKTSVRLVQYLSMVTGRPLSGEHVFHRSRGLVLSLEDGRDELERRLAAAMIHHKIARSELSGWLWMASPAGLKLADLRDGSPQAGSLERLVREKIAELKLDFVAFDPFVKSHGVPENDNNAIDFVATLMTRIAIDCQVACDAPHHVKKGTMAAGDADAGRGASAFKDGGRLVYTLMKMEMEEAAALGIGDAERRTLVRLDNAKVNLAPPTSDAKWFKLVGVRIGNATSEYPDGDNVQAAEPWAPPDIFTGVSNSQWNLILDQVDKGLPRGERYSSRPQDADRYVGLAIATALEVAVAQTKPIIKAWLKSGLLVEAEYRSEEQRKDRKCVNVDHSKRPGAGLNA